MARPQNESSCVRKPSEGPPPPSQTDRTRHHRAAAARREAFIVTKWSSKRKKKTRSQVEGEMSPVDKNKKKLCDHNIKSPPTHCPPARLR